MHGGRCDIQVRDWIEDQMAEEIKEQDFAEYDQSEAQAEPTQPDGGNGARQTASDSIQQTLKHRRVSWSVQAQCGVAGSA